HGDTSFKALGPLGEILAVRPVPGAGLALLPRSAVRPEGRPEGRAGGNPGELIEHTFLLAFSAGLTIARRSPSKRNDHPSVASSTGSVPTVPLPAFHGPLSRASSAAVALRVGSAGRAGARRHFRDRPGKAALIAASLAPPSGASRICSSFRLVSSLHRL